MVAGIWLLASWARSVYRKEGVSLMNKVGKIAIVVVLIAAVVVVVAVKKKGTGQTSAPGGGQQIPTDYKPEQLTGKGLPTLIDLGADTCIPCKMMTPILEELKKEYAGRLAVHFLDVRENHNLITLYNVSVIPTQIFYDASGKKLFRHKGFYSKDDILNKFKELGVDLSKTQ